MAKNKNRKVQVEAKPSQEVSIEKPTQEEAILPAPSYLDIFNEYPKQKKLFIDVDGNIHRDAFNIMGKLISVNGKKTIAEVIERPTQF